MNKEIERVHERINRLTEMITDTYIDIDKKEAKFRSQLNKITQRLESLRIENEMQQTKIENLEKVSKKLSKNELERNKN